MHRVLRTFSILVMLAMTLIFTSILYATEGHPSKLPKWKLKQQENIANSAMVCRKPRISQEENPQNPTTAYYSIEIHHDGKLAYLDVDDDGQVFLNANTSNKPRNWLATRVGEGRYDIATCAFNRPTCLAVTAEKKLALDTCDDINYGNQAWWLKGNVIGTKAGSWFMGNDGLDYNDCLIVDKKHQLVIKQCDDEHNGWLLKRDSKHNIQPPSPVEPIFPNDAKIVHYQCKSGKEVEVFYDNSMDRVFVRYGNALHILNAVISGSGAKFSNPVVPWGWWSKGNTGAIYQTKGDEQFLENCSEITNQTDDSAQLDRVWAAQDFEDSAAVTDCGECNEDQGIMLSCSKGSQTAEVNVWVNADEAVQSGNLTLQVEIDNRSFHYPFTGAYFGMIGHPIAVYKIQKDDPFLTALQHGHRAIFHVVGDERSIRLNGSSKAIEHFQNFCGWTN